MERNGGEMEGRREEEEGRRDGEKEDEGVKALKVVGQPCGRACGRMDARMNLWMACGHPCGPHGWPHESLDGIQRLHAVNKRAFSSFSMHSSS